MAIIRWDPFSELNSLHEQVNSLFSENFSDLTNWSKATPITDVYSDDKSLIVEAHLPSFKESEISVDQHQGALEIKAEHQDKVEDKSKKYIIRESVSQYFRRFELPKNSDVDHIKAKFNNGILKITVPYKELPKPQRIAIQADNK